jgi:hypothetical protein
MQYDTDSQFNCGSERRDYGCAKGGPIFSLRKLKPGLFNQLGGPPIVVRGMEWSAVVLAGLKHAPTVVAMRVVESQLLSSPARGRSPLSPPWAKRSCGLGCSSTGTPDLATHPWQATTRTPRRSMMPGYIAHA